MRTADSIVRFKDSLNGMYQQAMQLRKHWLEIFPFQSVVLLCVFIQLCYVAQVLLCSRRSNT